MKYILLTIAKQSKSCEKEVLIDESLIVFFIIISPFIFKVHEYFSEMPEATISVFRNVIDRNGFAKCNTYTYGFC